MHLVGYLYEDYHDARSLEHQKPTPSIVRILLILSFTNDPTIPCNNNLSYWKWRQKGSRPLWSHLTSRNETATLSQKVGNWLPTDAVSYTIRTGAAAAPLREPKQEQTLPSSMWRYALVDSYQRFGRTCQTNYMTSYLLRQYIHRQRRGKFTSPKTKWNISSEQRRLEMEKFWKAAEETAWNLTSVIHLLQHNDPKIFSRKNPAVFCHFMCLALSHKGGLG